MRWTTGIFLTGVLLAAGAPGAMAAVGEDGKSTDTKRPAARGAQGLKSFDSDKNLAVTIDEFLKRRVEAFTKRDKNGDGSLDSAELGQAPLGFRQQRQERRMEQVLIRLDTNADGKVTKAEFDVAPVAAADVRARRNDDRAERQKLLFSFYDRNADGVVEKAEYDAGRAEENEFARKRRMHALDRDGDGKVTLEEYTADARFRFMRLDLDRDGRITAVDLPPAERQLWSQR